MAMLELLSIWSANWPTKTKHAVSLVVGHVGLCHGVTCVINWKVSALTVNYKTWNSFSHNHTNAISVVICLIYRFPLKQVHYSTCWITYFTYILLIEIVGLNAKAGFTKIILYFDFISPMGNTGIYCSPGQIPMGIRMTYSCTSFMPYKSHVWRNFYF